MTSRTSNVRLSYAHFGSGVCGNFNQITPYYLKWISSIFSSKFLQYFKNTFFRTLVYGDFLASSIEKDSLATTRDSFEDCILACKNFHKQSLVILFKNGCSVRHMFCVIFVPLSVAKILEKKFEVVQT